MEFGLSEKNKKIIVTVLALLALFLIVVHFTDTPKVWVDEGVFTEVARNFAAHGVLDLQTSPGHFFPMATLLTTSYPVIFPVALSLKVFGIGVAQARLPMIAYIMLLVIAVYYVVKKRYGFLPAILSVLLLISFSPLYGNGRPVQGEVPGLAWLAVGLWCSLLWEQTNFNQKKWAVLAGLAFGLSAATKPLYLFGLGGAFVISLCFWYKKIPNKKTIWIFILGFIIPLIVQVLVQFRSRETLLHIIPTYLYLASNHNASTSLIKTILLNAKRFLTEQTPLLFTILALTIIISFVRRWQKSRLHNFSLIESIVIFFVAINWLAYLMGTGWYRYFFPAHTLLYILFPAAFLALAQKIRTPVFQKVAYVFLTGLIVFQFFHLIFLSDTSFTVSRTRNAELTAALSTVKPSQSVLFYNAPEAIIFYKGENYAEYLIMDSFLEAGDKNALKNPKQDIIVTNDASPNDTLVLPGYTKEQVSRYYIFRKKN
jgi:4-amino-4-deoxy-L-arabinose transferase-like glycosyltransferase